MIPKLDRLIEKTTYRIYENASVKKKTSSKRKCWKATFFHHLSSKAIGRSKYLKETEITKELKKRLWLRTERLDLVTRRLWRLDNVRFIIYIRFWSLRFFLNRSGSFVWSLRSRCRSPVRIAVERIASRKIGCDLRLLRNARIDKAAGTAFEAISRRLFGWRMRRLNRPITDWNVSSRELFAAKNFYTLFSDNDFIVRFGSNLGDAVKDWKSCQTFFLLTQFWSGIATFMKLLKLPTQFILYHRKWNKSIKHL